MSSYSDAWHAAPPAVRDFYRNFERRYTGLRFPDFDLGPSWMPRSRAFNAAQRNWSAQYFAEGLWSPAVVLFVDNDLGDTPSPTLPYDPYGFYTYQNQYEWIPDYANDYPRTAYNAPRTYWTGKPRRRQNYTGA